MEAPKWLHELEQRLELLKKHKLQHEQGCGAACLKCKEGCAGLELHFWRKICLNCKSTQDDHFTEEGSDIKFEILTFKKDVGLKKEPKTFPKVLSVFTEKGKVVFQKIPATNSEKRKIEFDWLPEVPSEMALEYMASLPSEKLPIRDTEGSVQRKQLWKTQIPMTDIAPEHMSKMTTGEKQRFQDFLENIRNEIVGQGRVQRIHLKPFVATSSACFPFQEPQSCKKLEKTNSLADNNVATNPSIVPPVSQNWGVRADQVSSYDIPITNSGCSLKLPSFYYNKNKEKERMSNLSNFNPQNLLKGPDEFFDKNLNEEKKRLSNIEKQRLIDNRPDEDLRRDILPHPERTEFSAGLRPQGSGLRGFSNSPFAGQTLHNVTDQPVIIQPTYESPEMNTVFASHPHQGELVDISDDNANNLANLQLEDAENNNEVLVDKQMTCEQCHLNIESGSVVVTTKHEGSGKAWHPQCFVCTVCEELLVDLMYLYFQEKVYCLRHYASKRNIVRCYACDELIFSETWTQASDLKAYHNHHFCCYKSDTELAGKSYLEVDEQAVCLDCYRTFYAKMCQTCHKPLDPTEKKGITLKDLHWHAQPSCFCCGQCQKSLLGQQCTFKNNTPFCSSICVREYDRSNSSAI